MALKMAWNASVPLDNRVTWLPNTIGLADRTRCRSYCCCRESVSSIWLGLGLVSLAARPTSSGVKPAISGTDAHRLSTPAAAIALNVRRLIQLGVENNKGNSGEPRHAREHCVRGGS